tara:strand:- start:195 stop:788 length:594 start_codon:yes stop_codon:yes gene_type:complete
MKIMSNTLNIYQRINSIMTEGVYLKKGSAGQGTGAQYDELISKLAPLLSKNGIVITAEKNGDSRSRANAKGNYIFESDFTIHYINMDNPEDRFSTVIESHAMDAGDKAPGKAITYATKISMLKVFGIETGDNEESRADLNDVDFINQDQQGELFNLICDPATSTYTEKGLKIRRAYRFQNISDIRTKQYDKILKAAS